MTIIEALLRRRVSRLIISTEMIVVLASLLVVIYLLSATASDSTFRIMLVSGAAPVVAGLYVRALRLDEAPSATGQKKVR